MTALAFITQLREENHAFYSSDRGRGALRDFQQTFPHPWLYVGELLQNAVDAGARKIRLALTSGDQVLIVEHDGSVFSGDDVQALCTRGLSKKGAGTVGFMGIGFKAVFQSFEAVDVASGPWRFRFCVKDEVGEYGDHQRDWLGCVLPIDAERLDPPSAGMTCRFVLHHRLSRLGPITEDVAAVISLEVLALLARRGVQELDWHGQRWLLSQTFQDLDDHTTRVILEALDEHTGEVRQWVLFSARYQPSREAIARFLEHRQIRPAPDEREGVHAEARRERTVEVFCALDQSGMPVPPQHAHAYALLATGVSVPIGLHLQADWLLNTSRRELMEVETNVWHQEILAQLPRLLRAYFQWVTELAQVPEKRLTESYAVLPDWEQTDGTFAFVTASAGFRDAVHAALQDLSFLPVRGAERASFVTPERARLLPTALRSFDDARFLPWVLFGPDIVSATLLGARALGSLQTLALLRPLAPADLLDRWSAGAVGCWREGLGDRVTEAHLHLLHALAALDTDASWRESRLCCLPTTSGSWIDRQSGVGLPADWDAVPEQEPALRSWLEPFLPPRTLRLDWSFDRALLRDPSARQYVAALKRHTTEDVLRSWWQAQPATVGPEDCGRVLDVTAWVYTKRRSQPSLVTRVLCDTSKGTLLVALGDAVLADPYASTARRLFFAQYSVVSDRYAKHVPGVSDADWRSFFESASKILRGRLRLREDARVLSRRQLAQTLPSFDVPTTKSSAIMVHSHGLSFSSKDYLLIDPCFPDELKSVVSGHVTRRDAHAIGLWLQEARQDLVGKPGVCVAYVPYNSSTLMSQRPGVAASWVRDLSDNPWLYATDGTGPYTPAQVLAGADPARPDARVADLPEDLAATLAACGIVFGASIPDVASLDRLQREGPTASVERVLELVERALEDTTDDPDARAAVRDVLRTTTVFPSPITALPIDGASRVGADRLVQRGARGADLGGWLVPLETLTAGLGNDDPLARLVFLVGAEVAIPEAHNEHAGLSGVRRGRGDAPGAQRVSRGMQDGGSVTDPEQTPPRASRHTSNHQTFRPGIVLRCRRSRW